MKNRRGISTVVGAVFFVIIFATTISYVSYNMNLLSNFSNAIIVKNQADVDTNHEAFSVIKGTVDNNKFNITVQNTGNVPVNITRLYVQNKTDITWGVHKYSINQIVYPGHSLSKIGQGLSLFAKSTQGYDLKLFTSRGNVGEFFVNSVSQEPVYMQLYTLPPSGANNFNTTLLLSVTNNMTNGGVLSNFQPNMVVTNTTANAILISGPTPAVYPILKNGAVATFQWTYKIMGTNGQVANFKISLKNGYLNNYVSQNVTITNAITVTNVGHGGKGVYSAMQGSVIQLRNITSINPSHLQVSQNTTDVKIDTGALVLMTNGTLTGNMDLGTTGTAKIGSGNVIIRNPASTFATSLVNSAITANRTLTIPLITQAETFAVKPQILSATPANPTGTSSLTGVMAGVGGTCTITPKVTGRIWITVTMNSLNNAAGNGAEAQIRYGTGGAPANAAALTGTTLGSAKDAWNIYTASKEVPMTLSYIVSGLTVGTPYWLDFSEKALTAGTASFTNVNCVAIEL